MPQEQRYWFQQAAQINFYLNKIPENPSAVPPSQSAYFIQQMNKESLTSAVNNGEKHLVDYVRQPDGKSLGTLEQVI